MTGFDRATSIGDWGAGHPRTARVFEERQVDYCCGGDTLLSHAHLEKGLAAIVSRLCGITGHSSDDSHQNREETSLGQLCNHL
jgi:regulator of cell morphogenesis and NO signaling